MIGLLCQEPAAQRIFSSRVRMMTAICQSRSVSQPIGQQLVLLGKFSGMTPVCACPAGLGSPYFDLAVRQVAATRQHFCPSKPYEAHYFVFTDRNASAAPSSADVTFIRKVPQGWPRDSDDRYTWFIEV